MLIGIIADDLTGAADAAAPFAARGLKSHVEWSPSLASDSCDAFAWTSETRDLPAHSAADIRSRVRGAARQLAAFSPDLYFKKIDSTLRGHLSTELEAMRSELPGRLAIVCPAFVEHGRTVQNGVLHVNGMPVQRVRDAFQMAGEPSAVELSIADVRDSGLQSRLQELTARSVRAIDSGVAELVAGADPFVNGPFSIRTIFCDAETAEDLDVVARAVAAMPQTLLPVGSAGLARALARAVAESPLGEIVPKPSSETIRTRRLLVVVGSRNEVSRRQAACLSSRVGSVPIELSTEQSTGELEQLVIERFESGADICLLQSPERFIEGMTLPNVCSLSTIGRSVQGLSLIVTGGATAMSLIAQERSWSRIEVDGEIAPGIVTGRLVGAGADGQPANAVPIVLKAGGFGDEETLVRCAGLDS